MTNDVMMMRRKMQMMMQEMWMTNWKTLDDVVAVFAKRLMKSWIYWRKICIDVFLATGNVLIRGSAMRTVSSGKNDFAIQIAIDFDGISIENVTSNDVFELNRRVDDGQTIGNENGFSNGNGAADRQVVS